MAEKGSRKPKRGINVAEEIRENWKVVAIVITALSTLIGVILTNIDKETLSPPTPTSTLSVTTTPENSCDKYFELPLAYEIFSGLDTGLIELSNHFTEVLALKFLQSNGATLGGMKLQFRPDTNQIEIFSIADQYCMAISLPGESMFIPNGSENEIDFNQVPYIFVLTFLPSSSALEVDLHQK
ncbi:MAG: hypothetical protein Fur0022_08860 [Anaerolineales bacterium]